MNPKLLLVVVAALLLGAVAWSFLRQDALPPVSRPGERAANGDAAQSATEVVDAMREHVDGDADVVEAATHRREVVESYESLLPLPDDVEWTPIRVVDAETEEPVPGAAVRWYDATVQTAIRERELVDIGDQTIWKDHEQLALRFGWFTTSDERGVARVHRGDGTCVVARKDGRYGRIDINAGLVPPSDGFAVELEPDLGFDVQVVDDAGRPAAGVPIMVGVFAEDGAYVRPHSWGPLTMSAGPDATARIPHTQQLPKLEDEGAPQHYRVCTAVPGYEDAGVAFDPKAPPTEPVVLQLPALGSIAVRCEILGEQVTPDSATMYEQSQQRSRSFMFGGGYVRRPDDDGVVRFRFVPAGKEFHIGATCDGNWVGQKVTGPAAGVELAVVLRPDADAMMLTGRLLGPDRAPLAKQSVLLRVNGDVHHYSKHETGEDGRFLALLGKKQEKSQAKSIEFTLEVEGKEAIVASAAPRELRAGIEDLGDIVLQADELIVAGRCVVDGEPVEARGSIEYSRVAVDGERQWWRHYEARWLVREDGTFEMRGKVDADLLRLYVFAEGCRHREPIEFRRGQRDLLVELERGSKLAATMLVPDAGWQTLQASLTRTDALPGSEEHDKKFDGGVGKRGDGRQQADWAGLAAGTYTMAIEAAGFPEPLHVVPDIIVPLPEAGDPRLVDIDLRERLRVQIVRFFDADWKPIENVEGALFPLGQPESEVLRGHACWGKESQLLLPSDDPTMTVGVVGYRPQRVVCAGEPLDVRLDPWPRSVVTVSTSVELPEGAYLRLRIAPPGGDNRRWEAMWQSGRVSELFGPPSRYQRVENGQASLLVGDEPRLLQLKVQKGNKSVYVRIPKHTISLRDPAVTVTVADEALQKAIDAVK